MYLIVLLTNYKRTYNQIGLIENKLELFIANWSYSYDIKIVFATYQRMRANRTSQAETRHSACHYMFLLLFYYPVLCLLNPHNLARLLYEFSCTLIFLGKLIIYYIYSSPGYVSIDIQVIYLLCFQSIYIDPHNIFP